MVSYTFTLRDLFHAQVYRYFKVLVSIIILFGVFAIGVMVFTGAPFIIGLLLFFSYVIIAIIVMFTMLLVLAWIQYSFTYHKRIFKYQIRNNEFLIFVGDDEIYCNDFNALRPKVYRQLTYLYEGDLIVAFFPEKVRLQLLK